jgi:excisionase family DNA binding protein
MELEVERARYEADRCQRQFHSVEPENRLVARTLESRWNQALDRVGQLERELAEIADADKALSVQEQEKLRHLAADLPRLWNHPAAPFELKKRILRSVIQEMVLYVEATTLRILVHWQGGQHTEINLRKRKPGEHRWKTSEDTLGLIRQLARLMPDVQIAGQLNRMRIKSAKGHTWTRERVGNFRTVYDIPRYTPGERQERGELSLDEVAESLRVSYSTVQRVILRKQLPARRVDPGGPWIVRTEDLKSFQQNFKRGATGYRIPSSASPSQHTLVFPEDI